MTPPTRPGALVAEDRERQAFVSLALVFCLFAALVGLGLLGEPVVEVGGGVFAPDATLLAPARWTFLLWRPLYVGFVAYTVWQWLPGRGEDPLNRAVGWYAGWTMIAAGAWIMISQHGWLWAGVLVMFGMVIALARLMDEATALDRSRRGVVWVVVDATFGLCLGWTCVTTLSMVAATLDSVHISAGGMDPVLALPVLALGVVVGWRVAFRTGGSVPVAAGFVWAFAGIAWQRLLGEPASTLVGVGSLVGAALVVVGMWWARRLGAVNGIRDAFSGTPRGVEAP